MSKLEQAYNELDRIDAIALEQSPIHQLDPRAKTFVIIIYLITMLSLPLTDLSELLLFFIFPILTAPIAGISYLFLLKRSLIILPFVAFIGIFNPIFDKETAFYIGSFAVTKGWITFFSIIIRGLLSVQGAMLLILTSGFYGICRGLEQMKIPSIFTTQLLFVYRYIFVLIQESISVTRARDSRSFGKKGQGLKIWGIITGQLLIRTFERANRINQAMLSRGFKGIIKESLPNKWHLKDTFFLILWTIIFLAIRFLNIIENTSTFFQNYNI